MIKKRVAGLIALLAVLSCYPCFTQAKSPRPKPRRMTLARPPEARATEPQKPAPILADGTIMLQEILVSQRQIKTPELGTCHQNVLEEKWCNAFCRVTSRKTYQRTYQIVNRPQFVQFYVQKAAKQKENRDILLAITTAGLVSLAAEIIEGEDKITAVQKICEKMPERFTNNQTEERTDYQRYPGVINAEYLKQISPSLCE
ncbi:MAG: hypothetical protein AAB091_00375 [Elusimicrobiota bacterium]